MGCELPHITAKSVNLVIGFYDTDTPNKLSTIVLQRRANINQDDKPQSFPGGTQLTAAIKVALPQPLSLLEFHRLSQEERQQLIDAARKECGEKVAEMVGQATDSSTASPGDRGVLAVVNDFINDKGRWIRTVLLRLSDQSGESLKALLVPPKEVAGFMLASEVQPDTIGIFTKEDRLPIQEGGRGIPEGVIRMFADDREALLKAAKMLGEARRAE